MELILSQTIIFKYNSRFFRTSKRPKICKIKISSCVMMLILTIKGKKKKKGMTTNIKTRGFLTNIVYSRLNKNKYENIYFVFNVFKPIAQNLNPISLDRKF